MQRLTLLFSLRRAPRGVVTDGATGKKVAFIDGKWDSRLEIKYGPHDPASLLWQTRPWPADADKYYGVRPLAIPSFLRRARPAG